MRVCVFGLWHLGAVTSACLAALGHDVVGLDEDAAVTAGLAEGKAPLFEPGLDDLIRQGLDAGRLRYSTDAAVAGQADIVWVTFDTPVDDADRADTDFVIGRVQRILPLLAEGTLVLVSAQLPVGSIAGLEDFAREKLPGKRLHFACSPENLRLGKALDAFQRPDRIVIGCRSPEARERLTALLGPVTGQIEWMTVESAEMTKHALNAFLAVSVTFANEIAALCERAGADAKEVERGLKSEARIGPRAYLAPGGAFAGGTLARDIEFLNQTARKQGLTSPLLESILSSNHNHKSWPRRKLTECLSDLSRATIAVWGLTYKPGTDTLRRSQSVELCDWLLAQGARLKVHDPRVKTLPASWAGRVTQAEDPLEAARDADALVIGTEWPDYRDRAEGLAQAAKPGLAVIDANRHLRGAHALPGLRYFAVGVPQGMPKP